MVPMTPEQLDLITQWHRAQAACQQWQDYERDLRQRVVLSMFGDYGDGSRSADIGNGYVLTNNNITRHDVKPSPELDAMMRRIADYKPTASIAPQLLAWKPRLSVRAYKLLPGEVRGQFDKFVTTTPQSPQLKIIPPKA